MADINVTMDIKDGHLKKELIDKFHWMSGSVRREVFFYFEQLICHSTYLDVPTNYTLCWRLCLFGKLQGRFFKYKAKYELFGIESCCIG